MELIHDALSIERVAGRTRAQAMVEGEIMPPAGKAGMANVLSVEGRAAVNSLEALENRLSMDGTIELFVMYVGDDEKVGGFTSSSGFKHSVEVQGVAPGMRAGAVPSLQSLDFTLSDERSLRVRAVIDLDCTVVEKAVIDAMQGASDIKDLEIKALELKLLESGEDVDTNQALRENVRIPQGLPPLGAVLYSTANPRITSLSIEDSKAAVEGEVRIMTLYTSDDDSHAPLTQVQHTLPFGQIVSIDPNAKEAGVDLCVRDIKVIPAEDENRNILEIEAMLGMKITPKKRVVARALTDAYSPSRNVSAIQNRFELRQGVAEGTGRCMIRDSVAVPEGMPTAMRALYLTACPVITNAEAVEDRLALSGVLFSRVVYACREGKLHGFSAELPLRAEIEVPGMTDNMEAAASALCESAVVSGSGDALDVKITLECTGKGFTTDRANILTGLEELELENREAGVMVYFTGKGETRWDIAKRFRIPQSELQACNPDLPEHLQSGEKVLLLLRN